ncbi:MAG: hypothetical protein M3Q44_00445 [bacterium]|nr:hypothetical protein [bacterium]
MKKITFAVLAVLLFTACTQKVATDSTELTSLTPQPKTEVVNPTTQAAAAGPLTFKLATQNNSKQDGTAILEDVSGRIKVTITLSTPVTTAEPVHIHLGSCPTPGDIKYSLTDVVSGKSETILPDDVSMDALKDMGALSINVHKSAADLKTYVSCGDLNWSTATNGATDVMEQ